VVLAGLLARPQVVDRQVHRGEEPAGVDLRTLQAEGRERLERLGQRLVVQAGGVGTELHGGSSQETLMGVGAGAGAVLGSGPTATSAPPRSADSTTDRSSRRLCSPADSGGQGGSASMPATCSRNARAWKPNRSFCPKPTPGKSIGRPPVR